MTESARARVEQLLADDPVCGGCVASGTVDAIVEVVAPSGKALPVLTYDEALAVGERLWARRKDAPPRDSFGWADLVQLTIALAGDAVAERKGEEE